MPTAGIEPTVSASALLSPAEPKPANAAEAAQQFEALLIAQMLRSAREQTTKEGEDSTAETMFDVAGQQFAKMLAQQGGLGLAKIVTRGLSSATEALSPRADPD